MSVPWNVGKKGGTIVCATESRDGLPNHGSYGEVLASQPNAAALLEMINAPGYSRPDQWQVQIQAQILMKSKVLVKNGFMSDHEIRAAHFEPMSDVSKGVASLLAAAGPPSTL